MRKNWKLVTCLSFALILLISSFLVHTAAAVDTLAFDALELHSWEELKLLGNASKKGNDTFLSELSALDESCKLHSNGHVRFGRGDAKESYHDVFAAYYDKMLDLRVLAPKSSTALEVKVISLNSYDGDVATYSVNYQIEQSGEKFYFSTTSEKDYSNFLTEEKGEPDTCLQGDGYTVKIWRRESADLNYQTYRGYFFLEGEDHPSFFMTLASSNWQEDIPGKLVSLYSQFRVTTAREILKGLNPWRIWIWVAVQAL